MDEGNYCKPDGTPPDEKWSPLGRLRFEVFQSAFPAAAAGHWLLLVAAPIASKKRKALLFKKTRKQS